MAIFGRLAVLKLLPILLKSETQNLHTVRRFLEGLPRGSPGDFVVDLSSSTGMDMVVRRESEMGEHISVSASVGEVVSSEKSPFPCGAFFKVLVMRPAKYIDFYKSNIIQVDCETFHTPDSLSDFNITNAFHLTYYSSSSSTDGDFDSCHSCPLGEVLREKYLKEYLVKRGVSSSFVTFLLYQLHCRKHDQYHRWLAQIHAMLDPH